MNTQRFLLFDLGGVLLENRVFPRLQFLMSEPEDTTSLKSRWLASTAVRQFELGRITSDEFATAFMAEWGLSLEPDVFLEEFDSWPTDFYPNALEILEALRRTYKVGCLSNSNAIHWQKFNSFRGLFDIALSSHLLGAIKPDREAFVKAVELSGFDAAQICFFDDTAENVEMAKRVGMRAYHVEGIADLKSILTREKLL